MASARCVFNDSSSTIPPTSIFPAEMEGKKPRALDILHLQKHFPINQAIIFIQSCVCHLNHYHLSLIMVNLPMKNDEVSIDDLTKHNTLELQTKERIRQNSTVNYIPLKFTLQRFV